MNAIQYGTVIRHGTRYYTGGRGLGNGDSSNCGGDGAAEIVCRRSRQALLRMTPYQVEPVPAVQDAMPLNLEIVRSNLAEAIEELQKLKRSAAAGELHAEEYSGQRFIRSPALGVYAKQAERLPGEETASQAPALPESGHGFHRRRSAQCES